MRLSNFSQCILLFYATKFTPCIPNSWFRSFCGTRFQQTWDTDSELDDTVFAYELSCRAEHLELLLWLQRDAHGCASRLRLAFQPPRKLQYVYIAWPKRQYSFYGLRDFQYADHNVLKIYTCNACMLHTRANVCIHTRTADACIHVHIKFSRPKQTSRPGRNFFMGMAQSGLRAKIYRTLLWTTGAQGGGRTSSRFHVAKTLFRQLEPMADACMPFAKP